MKRNIINKAISLLLVLAMLMPMATTAFAAEDTNQFAPQDGELPEGIDPSLQMNTLFSEAPVPEIVGYELDINNKYVDVQFNTAVFASGLETLTPSNFSLVFSSNGGDVFSAVITDLKNIDDSELTDGANNIRFYIELNGEPIGVETFEIKPSGPMSVSNMDNVFMDEDQTTGKILLNSTIQRIVSASMAPDNTYVDATFYDGVYGDSGLSEAVTAEDFIIAFMQNDGAATGAVISEITRDDGTTPSGGEKTLRFHLDITGAPSGDETIEIRAKAGSVYSSKGIEMSPDRPMSPVKLNPPELKVTSVILAADNSYLDVTFNTGVYGSEFDGGPVYRSAFKVYAKWGTYVASSSVKAADNIIESRASELKGGEKTVRIFLDVEGDPAEDELILKIDGGVWNSAGALCTTETDYPGGIIIRMNALDPGFAQASAAYLDQNNRYVDIYFNSGMYGADDGATPLSVSSFQLIYNKNNGSTENVTIRSLKQNNSKYENEAAPLTGGENVVRAFLSLSGPAKGMTESIEIRPANGNAIFTAGGKAMSADKTTKRILLYKSKPEILSARLAKDNSYIDVEFNFGIYGDSNHSTPVTTEHFGIDLINYGGPSKFSIKSVRRNDSENEAEATPLTGGESTVRIFLNVNGSLNENEKLRLFPGGKTIYDSLGNAMANTAFAELPSIQPGSIPGFVTAILSDDMSYLDVFFNTGIYGDSNHASPAGLSNFTLLFNSNEGDVTEVTLDSVTKNDNTPLEGGEKALRFFLNMTGVPSGIETIELKPNGSNPPYSGSGNPMPAGQTTKAIPLSAPAPEIISAQLAPDDSYVDITFNLGVYGNSMTSVSKDAFTAILNRNGGDAASIDIVAVKMPDNDSYNDASPLYGGEDTIRVFLGYDAKPSGGETIEIKPSNDVNKIYTYSGKSMSGSETTGVIRLNPYPKIIRGELADDNSYIDITFNTGVYGRNGGSELGAVTRDDLNLTLNRSLLGGLLSCGIKSVKKPDNTQEALASSLTGGEEKVRVFLSLMGSPNGEEKITIYPKEDSLFSKDGLSYPIYDSTKAMQPVNLKVSTSPQFTGAVIAEDNSYMDVSFNIGVYGAADGKTPVTVSNFLFQTNFPTTISSVKNADDPDESKASALIGGEKTLRFFFRHSQYDIPDKDNYIKVESASLAGRAGVYSNTGTLMAMSQNTGEIHFQDLPIRIESIQLAKDSSYIDVELNKGVYGDKDRSRGVDASGLSLAYIYRSSSLSDISIISVKKDDAANEEAASLPTGGETRLRLFLKLTGKPVGSEIINISPKADSIFDAKGYSVVRSFDAKEINLSASSPEIESAVLSEDALFMDITFNTGVYGDSAHSEPVTASSFQAVVECPPGQSQTVNIKAVKKNNSFDASAAAALEGGEKTVRMFLEWGDAPVGGTTIEVRPADGLSVFSSGGNPAAAAQTTGKLPVISYYPGIISAQMAEDNSYIDVTFNTGVYGELQNAAGTGAADVSHFSVSASANGADYTLKNWYVRKNDGKDISTSSPLSGGEKVLRFFLEYEGNPSEDEAISIVNVKPIYSKHGKASESGESTCTASFRTPLAKIISVSAAHVSGNDQYIDVIFNTGVYGNKEHTLPVDKFNFELVFERNGGNAGSAYILKVTRPDNGSADLASPLKGGEKTVRCFIGTDGVPSGEETVEIKAIKEELFGLVIYNAMGQPIEDNQTTNAIRLADCMLRVISAKIGVNNRYIDITYSLPVNEVSKSDFILVFRRNGGTAKNVTIADAKLIAEDNRTVRITLNVDGLASGQETIEIRPANDDAVIARGIGVIYLASSYPASWVLPEGTKEEPFGWMTDTYISAGNNISLLLRNDGTVMESYTGEVLDGINNAMAVAAGNGCGLILHRDGTVSGWGNVVIPQGLNNVKAIDMSLSKGYVLFGDGTVGYFSQTTGLLEKYKNLSRVTAISAGNDDHLAVIYDDGRMGVFGDNYYGQCDFPDFIMAEKVKAIAAGDGFTLAFNENGWLWGAGKFSGCLFGSYDPIVLSASGAEYMMLGTDGVVHISGPGGKDIPMPDEIKNLRDIIAVSAGENLYSVIRKNGDVLTWRSDDLNNVQCINIYANTINTKLANDNSYIDVEFRDSKGDIIRGFGLNGVPLRAEDFKVNYIQKNPSLHSVSISSIKDEDDYVRLYLDVKGVPSSTDVIEIVPSSTYSIYFKNAGTLLGSQASKPITLNENAQQQSVIYSNRISAGWKHGLAIKENSTVVAWGSNEYGQTDVPVNLGKVRQVSAGYHHSVALKVDGTISVWGDNYYGQCNVPYGLKNIKQIAAGGYHTLALDYDGRVYAWGDNFYKQCEVPQGLKDVIWVAAGGHHSLALLKDGTIVAWGDNYFGQGTALPKLNPAPEYLYSFPLGVLIAGGEDFTASLSAYPGAVNITGGSSGGQEDALSLFSDITSVSAGYNHVLALTKNGEVKVWGDNSKGQCDVPEDLTDVAAIAAGAFFSVAIKENGSIIAWGENDAGQCNAPLDLSVPRFVRAELKMSNTYRKDVIDIYFNKGVYGGPNAAGPVSADSFEFIFDSAGSTAQLHIFKAYKVTQYNFVDYSAQLEGGEDKVRIEYSISGELSGKETLVIKAKNDEAIFDAHGNALSSALSTNTITFKKAGDERVDIDSYATTDKLSYEKGYQWVHKPTEEPDQDQMLVVGLTWYYSYGGNNYPPVNDMVTVNGVPMTHVVSNSRMHNSVELFYMLGSNLKTNENGEYVIKIKKEDYDPFKGYGISVLLKGVAQMGPEAIDISCAPWEISELTTRTDEAVVVELVDIWHENSDREVKAELITSGKNTSGATMAIYQVNKARSITSSFKQHRYNWMSASIAFRNAKYPANKNEEAKAPPSTAVNFNGYAEGGNIVFAEKALKVDELAVHNNKLVRMNTFSYFTYLNYSKNIRTSDDGETWSPSVSAPKVDSRMFSAGGKLYLFGEHYLPAEYYIASSPDGSSWNTIALPSGHNTIHHINAVAANDGDNKNKTIVAVGMSRKHEVITVISRDNGATWELAVFPGSNELHGIVCINGNFVTWDASNVWTGKTGKGDWKLSKSFPGGTITQVLMRSGELILCGKNLDSEGINLYTSTDGVVWDPVDIVYKDPKITAFDGFYSIAYAQNTYAAAGGNYIAAMEDPGDIGKIREARLYAVDNNISVDYLMSLYNRFYTRYAGGLFSSDDLKKWYFETSNSGDGEIISFKGKAITTSDGYLMIGYLTLPVESVTPYIDETGVPIGENITIGFGEAVKPMADSEKTIRLVNNETLKEHPISVRFDGWDVVISPVRELDYYSSYTVFIPEGTIMNQAGTKANREFNFKFTTTRETGNPKVVSTSLGDGIDVPAEQPITIDFDRFVHKGSTFGNIGIAPADAPDAYLEISCDLQKSRLTVTPRQNLENGRRYILTLPGACVEDVYKNYFDAWSMEFSVKADDTPPSVTKTLPVNYGERIPASPTIEVHFNENVKAGKNFDRITLRNIRSGENTQIDVSIQQETGTDGRPLNNKLIVELPGDSALELHHTYRVTVPAGAVADMAGNELESDFSFVFTEEIKNTGPVLIDSNPRNNAGEVDINPQITLLFDRPIRLSDKASYLQLSSGSDLVDLSTRIERNKIILIPVKPLEYDTEYTLWLGKDYVMNQDGSSGNDKTEEIVFTTEKDRIVGTFPHSPMANSVCGVSFDSEAAQGYKFNDITMEYNVDGNSGVASARFILVGSDLLIIPEYEYEPGTYTVTIPRGAVRFTDGTVNNRYEFSFTTEDHRSENLDYSFTGTIELRNALFEKDLATFDATECFEALKEVNSRVEFLWDLGDGSPLKRGALVNHTYDYRGNYNVILISKCGGSYNEFIKKSVPVIRKANRDNTLLDVAPYPTALLNAGDSVKYTITLTTSDMPMINRPIKITREYPSHEGKPSEHLATINTDRNGMVEYIATLPQDCESYHISFSYDDINIRRMLKNAQERGEISGYVINDRNEVMKNALISVGNRATVTDANGYYSIADLEPGIHRMVVSAERHYDYISNISLYQKGTVKNITLMKVVPSQKPIVRMFSVNDTTSADGKTFFFLEGVDAEITIDPYVDWKGHEPGYLELLSNGVLLNRVNYPNTFSANAVNFKHGDKLTVIAYSKEEGFVSEPSDLKIHMVKSLPGDFPIDLEPVYIDGKYMVERNMSPLPVSTPVITDIPVLKGGPFAFLTDPIHIYGEMSVDGTFYAITDKQGIGYLAGGAYMENTLIQKYLAKRKAASEAEKKQISAKQSRSRMGYIDVDSRIDATFYWKYNIVRDGWDFDNGILHLGISTNAYGSASYGIPKVPLSVYISGKFELIMDAYIKAVNNNGDISYNGGTLDFSRIFIEIAGGISAFIAKAEVYFNGTGAVKIDFSTGETNYYIEVTGGARASALAWSVSYEFLKYTWGDPSPWGLRSAEMRNFEGNPAMLLGSGNLSDQGLLPESADELEPMSRDYLQTQSGWLPDGGGEGANVSGRGMMRMFAAGTPDQDIFRTTVLRAATFPQTEHFVTPYGQGAFMVLVEDEPLRSILNQTCAKYSIYDGTGWSYPMPIDASDNTADYRPVAVAVDNGVIAAWENLNGILAPEAQLSDGLAMEEIAVGVYDTATNTWSGIKNLTSDSYRDHTPKIAASGNEGILLWIKNVSEDYGSALSDSYISEDRIMFSKWDSTAGFGEPVRLAVLDVSVVDMSVAFKDGKGICVFATDEDNNMNTVTDQELYRMIYDGNTWSDPVRLTDNIVRDSSPQVCYLNGKAFIVWEQGGSLVYTDNGGASSLTVKSVVENPKMWNSFSMAVSGDRKLLTLVGRGSEGTGGNDLYEISYDAVNQLWGEEVRLTDDSSAYRAPSSVYADNELITVYNRDIIEDKVNPEDGQTYPMLSNKADLRVLVKTLSHDLALTEDEILLSENNPFPGGLVEISAVIENKGGYAEKDARVTFYEGDPLAGGRKIGQTQFIEEVLMPGKAAEARVQWEVPDILPADGIYVVVEPGNGAADARPSDNTAIISVLRPDLELTNLECKPLGDGRYIVTIKVTNASAVNVPGGIVSIYYGDGAGGMTLIEDDLEIGAMKAGEVVEFTYMWTPESSVFINGATDLIAAVDIADPASRGMSLSAIVTLEEESVLNNNIRMVTVNQDGAAQITFTVTFDKNGGDVGANPDSLEVVPDSRVGTLPAAPTRSGYTFMGWNTKRDGSGEAFTEDFIVSEPITVYAQWSKSGGNGGGSGGGSGSGGKSSSESRYKADVTDGSDPVKIDVTTDMKTGNAQAELTSAQASGDKDIMVSMPKISGVTSYSLIIPVTSLSAAERSGSVTLNTVVGSVTLPSDMLTGTGNAPIGDASDGKAQIRIGAVNPGDLSKDVQTAVGNRPIISLSLSINGRITEWKNPKAPVTVSIPYTPTEEELKNPDGITVWYIDGSGSLTEMKDAKYDPATKSVVFTVTHFSCFAVGYKAPAIFTDVQPGAWFYDAVTFIAERGITKGTGNGKFSPDAVLTRGQFITMLLKAYGIDEIRNPADNFSDAGNTYYTGYLAAAKAMGISKGVGGNSFAPDKAITRQEMFTLLYNVLKAMDKLPSATTGNDTAAGKTLADFTDSDSVASWAAEAMAELVRCGIVSGSGGKLEPTDGSTRAHMAQVLYNLLGK